MKKILVHTLSLIFLFALLFGISKFYQGAQNDPDRYYHFALSRYMVEQGAIFLKEYPPVEDLGWGEYFSDKEFLYHQFTRLGYWVAQDQGVIYISIFISFASLALVYFFGAYTASVPVGLVAACMLLMSPALYPRFVMVRPHVLAIFAFVGIVAFLLRRQPKWTLLFSLLFSLAYHAIYVPGIFFAALIGISYLWQHPKLVETRKACLFGFLGIGLGVLLNPYFPSNLISAWQISQIPGLMTGSLSHISFGQELYALASNHFLQLLSISLLATVFGVFFWGKSRDPEEQIDFLVLLVLCSFTGVLAFLSRRGAEYFVPAATFLFIQTSKSIWLKEYEMWKRVAFPAIALLLVVGLFVKDIQRASQVRQEKYVEDSLLAAEVLPEEPIKVFNCEWDLAPYILYKRPNAKVTDLLDPSLLYFANPPLFQAKSKLQQGLVGNPQALLSELFRANYVFCQNPMIVQQLQKDPFFLQVYPKFTESKFLSEAVPHVFRIEKEEKISFVKSGKGKFFSNISEEEFLKLDPKSKESFEEDLDFSSMKLLNFEQFFKNRSDLMGKGQGLANCVLVQPKIESSNAIGADFLAVGGGRNIRIWRNGKKIYESGRAFASNFLVQTVVPLQPSLLATDRIELIACSGSSANYWSLSLAFLSRTQLRDLCRWKNSILYPNLNQIEAEYVGTSLDTCLGPMATKPLPTEFWPGQLNRLY